MSNVMRRIVASIGILVGLIFIFVGIDVADTYAWTDPVGSGLQFGADFYTEIYDVTSDVGQAVNNNTDVLVKVCEAIGWLIVLLGAIDVCVFLYLLFAPKQKTYKKVFCPQQDDSISLQLPSTQPEQAITQNV